MGLLHSGIKDPYGVERANREISSDKKKEYQSVYPNGVDLTPGGEDHARLRNKLVETINYSRRYMEGRFPNWQLIDEINTMFIPLDQGDRNVLKQDRRKPVQITVPVSYAARDVLLSQLWASYIKSPIFRFNGRVGGDSIRKALLTEAFIQQNMDAKSQALQLNAAWKSMLSYGIGPITATWEMQSHFVEKDVLSQASQTLQLFGGERSDDVMGRLEEIVTFEGNRLHNIDPYQYLPDPSVSMENLQDGEFLGWSLLTTKHQKRQREKLQKDLFNVEYLKYMDCHSRLFESGQEENRRDRFSSDNFETNNRDRVNICHDTWLYHWLVPSEWGLGNIEVPMLWVFCLSGDDIITCAKPMNLRHGRIPAGCASTEMDGFQPIPMGLQETTQGLQQYTNFLYNSRIANVRKSVNDMFLVDPGIINMPDIMNPGAGLLVRLRPHLWGEGVNKLDQGIKQLTVNDVTMQHNNDAALAAQWLERTMGASQEMHGQLRKGSGEVSATESRNAMVGGNVRMDYKIGVMNESFMRTLGYLLANHTSQFVQNPSWVRITRGKDQDVARFFGDESMQQAMPSDMIAELDYDSGNAFSPVSLDSQGLLNALQIIGSSEPLFQLFHPMLMQIGRTYFESLGLKGIDSYLMQNGMQVNVLPDEQVQQQAQQGNVVPIQGAI